MSTLAEVVSIFARAKEKDVEGNRDEALALMDEAILAMTVYIRNEGDEAGKQILQQRLGDFTKYRNSLTVRTKLTEKETNATAISPADMKKVGWEDIVGLDFIKKKLKYELTFRMRFPDVFKDIKPWNTLLLYGPPGTGKTMLACAIATQLKGKFYSVSAGSLLSKWQGESERAIKNLFETARANRPSVIFIDEVDGLLMSRTTGDTQSLHLVKNEFLKELNEENKDVMFIGATNLPWMLDDAIRRRFDHLVHVPLPDAQERAALFDKLLPSDMAGDRESNIAELGAVTDGYSAADIDKIVMKHARPMPFERAAQATEFFLRDDGKYQAGMGMQMTIDQIPDNQLYVEPLSYDDVKECIIQIRPSVSAETCVQHEVWKNKD
jgi:vacuolar protein-sorting-associated protein 4